jgi:hypothetical protein
MRCAKNAVVVPNWQKSNREQETAIDSQSADVVDHFNAGKSKATRFHP